MNLKEINWKSLLEKKYWKIYAIILVALAVVITVVVLFVGGGKENPEVTTPQPTVPAVTTPEVTTPDKPSDVTTPEKPAETTVAFPSDEDNDPKKEDVFFD